MKRLIVAHDRIGTIGKEGELPWAGKLPADMAHFKAQTLGASVIMGRVTYESLPESFRPLPNRQNIILSMGNQAFQGALTVHSLEEAFAQAENEPAIIGGAQIYNLALPQVDRIIATEIDTVVEGGDAFFPTPPEDEWSVTDRQDFQAEGRNRFDYSFVTYDRRK